jgi:hypothetical protein
MNGQWKAIGEEKLSRREQREREEYKAVKSRNDTSLFDMNQSTDNDLSGERARMSKFSFN